MANNSVLKAAVADVVKQNGTNAITGALLQQSLLSMIDALGGNYQYAGIATPTTNPGTPDQNVYYLAATAGTYTNFGGIVLDDGDVAIIKGSGTTWTKEDTGVATMETVNRLQQLSVLLKPIVNLSKSIVRGYVYNNSGSIAQSSVWNYVIVPVSPNTRYYISGIPAGWYISYVGTLANIGDACQTWTPYYDTNLRQLLFSTEDETTKYFVFNILGSTAADDSTFENLTVERLYEDNDLLINKPITFEDCTTIGLLKADGTVNADYTTCRVSNFVCANGTKTIKLQKTPVAVGFGFRCVMFFDENLNIISSFEGTDVELNVPDNAAFFKICIQAQTKSEILRKSTIREMKSVNDFLIGQGLLRNDGTIATEYSNCFVSNKIPVFGNEKIYIANSGVDTGYGLNCIVIYDTSNSIIGYLAGVNIVVDLSQYSNVDYVVFSGVDKMVVCWESGFYQQEISARNQALTWNAVGDSITEGGQGTFYGHPDEDAYMLFPQLKKYLRFLKSENFGVGGTCIAAKSTPDGTSFVERICGLNGATPYPDADVWSIMGGINDVNYGSTIGTIENTSSDITTVYGALKKIIEYLQSKTICPKILFIVQPYLNYQREYSAQQLENEKKIAQAIVDVCELYGVPYINLYKMGGFSYFNVLSLTYDGVHPNVRGVEYIKNKIVSAFNSLI